MAKKREIRGENVPAKISTPKVSMRKEILLLNNLGSKQILLMKFDQFISYF